MEKGRRDAELGVWCIETSEAAAIQKRMVEVLAEAVAKHRSR
jgi:hypothetical protein